MTSEDAVVQIADKDMTTGEEELKKLHERLYGGDHAGRQSFWRTLFRTKGSVIVTVIPVSFLGALIATVLVLIRQSKPDLWVLPELRHPFVVQVFGIILSFVIVARTNVALSRYFGGMLHVHTMSSRWVDAFTSALGFLRCSADLHPPGSPKQEACVAVGLALLHWGTLAHALAINSLQTTQLGIDERFWEARITEMEPPENLVLDSKTDTLSMEDLKTVQTNAKSRSRLQKGAMTQERRVSLTEDGRAVEKAVTSSKSANRLMKLGVYGQLVPEEVHRLHGATDKVAIVLMWMEEAVSRAQVQGVILVAPPILARVYGEIGNGLEGFNCAYRIALVPFPFCFAQMIGWCLVTFIFLCPAVAFVFTGGVALTTFLTFFSLVGFWGLNRIAIELENPFGCAINHLPLAEMHHAYLEALGEMHQHPMPEYSWNVNGSAPGLPQLKRMVGK
jgi:predicted membrane chloride channel (bestrophin family)